MGIGDFMFKDGIHFLIKHEADGGNGGNGGANPAGGEGGQGGTPNPSDPDNPDGKPAPGDEKKFSQEEMNEIITERTTRAVAKALKEQKDNEQAEKDEAKRMANLTKEQKADLEREKLQNRINELEAKQVRSEMSNQARAKLTELEVTANDDVINLLVTDKAETTIANVEMYANAVTEAVEARYQKDRVGATPGRTASQNPNTKLSLGERLAKQQESATKANDPFAALERGKK